jgi:hypothetical protein
MAIDGGLRDKLASGTVLVARYKGAEHRAEVVRSEDGKTLYRLQDGREFKSPSSAGSAVMGGVACNGWRFWSLEADTATTDAKATPVKARKPRKPKAAAEPAEPTGTAPSEAPTEEIPTE